MNINCLTDLWTVLDLVHDRWFELTQVSFDQRLGEVTISLGEKRRGPYKDRLLKITGVLALEIKDEVRIGQYDLSNIEIDSSSSSIVIKSGFPLEMRLKMAEKGSLLVLKFPN
jgi:hypothetical protein